jgi:hypothetical protein
MEVSIGCGAAGVTVLDSQRAPIVEFSDVPIIGSSGYCGNVGFGAVYSGNTGLGFLAGN